MSSQDISFLMLILAPMVLLILYGRRNVKRAVRERDAAAPFAPKPKLAPNRFLRCFTEPERAYLGQQFFLARDCYFVGAWVYLVFFSVGLLPQAVNKYGAQQALAQRVWFSYFDQTGHAPLFALIIPAFAALFAMQPLTMPAQAGFSRTRPLNYRFLFWGRTGAAAATLLACVATGMASSFLLLLLFHGPVWRHLFDPMRGGITHEQARNLLLLSSTSAPRLFLSLATTTMLIFAVFVTFITLPLRPRYKGAIAVLLFLLCGWGIISVVVFHSFTGYLWQNLAPHLFLYFRPGPPPPWIFAVVPIALATALLFLARIFMERLEI